MKLTPMDIHNKEFNVRLHGFDQNQVDEFLDDIIDSYSDALDQIADLENQIAQLQENPTDATSEIPITSSSTDEFENLPEAEQASQILLSAQKSADLITENAQAEAKRIIAEAQSFAEQSQAQAIEESNSDQQAEIQRNIDVLESDYLRLKKRVGDFRDKTKMLLAKELEDLDDENWQYWLDRYYGTERLYPVEGEPIEPEHDDDTENEADGFLDTKDSDAVDLNEENMPEIGGEAIFTGDNPTNVEMDLPINDVTDDGPAIIFPEDNKN